MICFDGRCNSLLHVVRVPQWLLIIRNQHSVRPRLGVERERSWQSPTSIVDQVSSALRELARIFITDRRHKTYLRTLASRRDALIKHIRQKLAHNCKIFSRRWHSCNQNRVPLRNSHKDLAYFIRLGVDTIRFDNGHVMLIELKELSGECSHVDDVEQVGLARCHGELNVLTFVNQGGVWYRLGAAGVVCREEVVDEVRCFDVVYV